ncbi:MAG: outer membrane lipid asymmetry maintenance protein MlaD [Rhodospirillales bacterium]
MHRSLIETVLAATVLLVAAGFVLYTMNATGQRSGEAYDIKANFTQTPGLQAGATVQVAGVPVGYVSRVAVDPVTFDVEVRMEIDRDVALPVDSYATLSSDGALGGTEVQLHRGQAETNLQLGGFIVRTYSPVNLVDQVGRFIYGSDL